MQLKVVLTKGRKEADRFLHCRGNYLQLFRSPSDLPIAIAVICGA
jgi:hypothetical protein